MSGQHDRALKLAKKMLAEMARRMRDPAYGCNWEDAAKDCDDTLAQINALTNTKE